MKPKIKIILIAFALTTLMTANLAQAALVNCGGTNQSACTFSDMIQTVKNIINFLLSYAWLISILLIVVSGFRMLFSAGNEEAVTKAKSSLTHAIVGFIIILLSFVIINLVVTLLTGDRFSITDILP